MNLRCNSSKSCGLIKSSSGGNICFKDTRLLVDFNLSGDASDALYKKNDDYYKNVVFNVPITSFSADNVGGFICTVYYGNGADGSLNFENCITHGKMVVNQDLRSIGGFVGRCIPPLNITNCFNNISITNNSGCIRFAGGFGGDVNGTLTQNISMCGNCGDLIGNFEYVGGLFGRECGMSLENLKSYNCAKIQTYINFYDWQYVNDGIYAYKFVFVGGTAGGLFGYLDIITDVVDIY